MKQVFSIILALAMAACAAQNSDNGASSEDAPDRASGTSNGKATLYFKGSANELRSYGSSSASNSMVGCLQHSGIHHAEITLVTAKENQDVRNPSNWLNSLTVNFASSEIPTGRIVLDSHNRNAYINYSVMKDHGSSTVYYPTDSCILDISKSGNSVSIDIDCQKLVSGTSGALEISGHMDCSITQL
jgi:hypothetical protein